MQRLIPLFLLCWLVCGCAGPGGGQQIYQQGMDEANAGNVEAAIATLKRGVESHSGNLEMRFALGRLQYEQGEAFHLKELDLRRTGGALLESNRRDEGVAAQRQANLAHTQAVPHYRAAQEQFEFVVSHSDEPRQIAWASYLAMRVSLFFEEWREAYEHITLAIQEGKPTGKLLTNWRTFQANLKEKVAGPEDAE